MGTVSKTVNLTIVAPSGIAALASCSGQVSSVELQAFTGNEALSGNRDPNTNTLMGKKIFPDKNSLGDMQGLNRRKVKVIARTTGLVVGTKVYFKSYDVDAPSTDMIVDQNGLSGGDNRGLPQIGTLSVNASNGAPLSMCPDINGDCWAQTNSSGDAVVEFIVTMNPGDNFRIAANTNPTNIISDDKGNPLLTNNTQVSEMLTVWRRLHIEMDAMDKVIGNQKNVTIQSINTIGSGQTRKTILKVNVLFAENGLVGGNIIVGTKKYPVSANFVDEITIVGSVSGIRVGDLIKVVDDDDFNANDVTGSGNQRTLVPDGDEQEKIDSIDGLLSLMKESDLVSENVFAAAYIIPKFDGGGALINNSPSVEFKLNVNDTDADLIAQVYKGIQTTLLELNGNGEIIDAIFSGTDDFWISYLQLCYQGDILQDKYPNTEISVEGVTIVFDNSDLIISSPNDPVPQGGIASLIFLENAHENTHFTEVKGVSTLVPHEIGHQFGLVGDTATTDVMGNNGSTRKFLGKHINIMRWRVKSPGVN